MAPAAAAAVHMRVRIGAQHWTDDRREGTGMYYKLLPPPESLLRRQ